MTSPHLTRAAAEATVEAAFDAAMASFQPFEPSPHLAVAVSGGADSSCLALLADRWAASHGGRVTALIVDHALRSGSREEAQGVAARLGRVGIASHILTRSGGVPENAIQRRARDDRYALLQEWCEAAGVLHLLLGHQLEDNGETHVLREAAKSGPRGLAGIAPIRETDSLRLLRPLLRVKRADIRDWLKRCGQEWVEDPSNRDRRFTRVRVRHNAAHDLKRHAAATETSAIQRRSDEREDAAVLARAVCFHPAGFVVADTTVLAGVAVDTRSRILSRLTQAVGGGIYPPRGDRLARAEERLFAADERTAVTRTLGGCIFRPHKGGKLLIHREPRAMAARLPISGDGPYLWDGRFRIVLQRVEKAGSMALEIGALGAEGWRTFMERRPTVRTVRLPAPVRATLPAVFADGRPILVPHLSVADSQLKSMHYEISAFHWTVAVPAANGAFPVV